MPIVSWNPLIDRPSAGVFPHANPVGDVNRGSDRNAPCCASPPEQCLLEAYILRAFQCLNTMIEKRLRSPAPLLMGCVLAGALLPCAVSGQSPAPQTNRFDVLFLAADAPVWLNLRLDGAGEGLQAVRQRFARMVIQTVDADKDGLASAAEAARLPARGRPGTSAQLLGEDWSQYDTSPQDGQLSPEEYLVAVQPYLGPAFTIRRKAPVLLQSVQLMPRLDDDSDGRVSQEEIVRGTQTLAGLDFDDDGTFSPAELQPFPQAMLDAAMAEQQGDDADAFVIVDADTEREELRSRLYRKYASDAGISSERSGLLEFAFAEADADKSGLLDETEAAAMLRPRPAVEIAVDVTSGIVRVGRLSRSSTSVSELPVESPRRIALRLGSEAVEFSAYDNRYAAADQINLLKIRFLQGDVDKNSYMSEQEFVSLSGLEADFADVDADTDGKVFIDELERFLRIESYLAQCSLEMEVEAVEKPLFTILDANIDRRLSAREFAVGIERLQEFDQDGDRVLDSRELAQFNRFRVKFAFVVPSAVRPEQNMAMMSQQRMPLVGRTPRSGPRWFLNMDRNQDGEVPWREFLGPHEAFRQLDVDGSGWIDAEEAGQSGSGE
jgi:hypothetical protein